MVPGAEDMVPVAEDKVPGAEDKVPGAEDKVPGAEDKSDLRMCTKEASFYLQTVYLGFYFILCSCKA